MKKIDLIPVDDRVIVKPNDVENVSSGGVIIPEGSLPEADSGIVVAVGPGIRRTFMNTDFIKNQRFRMECNVGDKVFYSKFGPNKLEYENEEYIVIRESELLAIKHNKGNKNED